MWFGVPHLPLTGWHPRKPRDPSWCSRQHWDKVQEPRSCVHALVAARTLYLSGRSLHTISRQGGYACLVGAAYAPARREGAGQKTVAGAVPLLPAAAQTAMAQQGPPAPVVSAALSWIHLPEGTTRRDFRKPVDQPDRACFGGAGPAPVAG